MTISLVFIVNGEDVPVIVLPGSSLAAARDEALKKSCNTSRPSHEWEVRNAHGVPLDVTQLIGSFGFEINALIFVTLAISAGGNRKKTTLPATPEQISAIMACRPAAPQARCPACNPMHVQGVGGMGAIKRSQMSNSTGIKVGQGYAKTRTPAEACALCKGSKRVTVGQAQRFLEGLQGEDSTSAPSVRSTVRTTEMRDKPKMQAFPSGTGRYK